MADALYEGRRLRTFNLLDEGNREALPIEIGTPIPSAGVIRVLDDLVRLTGACTGPRRASVSTKIQSSWLRPSSNSAPPAALRSVISSQASRIRMRSSSASIAAIARR
jgi:hypothetical protein